MPQMFPVPMTILFIVLLLSFTMIMFRFFWNEFPMKVVESSKINPKEFKHFCQEW